MKKQLALILALLCIGASVQAQRNLTVEELYGLIEENNNQIHSARTGIEAARHGVEAAKANRLPDVNIELKGSLNGDVTMLDRDFTNSTSFTAPRWGNSFQLEAQQAIYTGGAISAGIRLAELGKQMEEVNLTSTRNNVRFSALAQYLELIKMDNALRVYDENIQLMHRVMSHLEARQQQGMAMRNDLTRHE
ncbi:MAG: TolC family protein, partial [Bacteroidales bacterium]|nr:TolC family protein [Bacteroidales bacterium]